MLSEQLKPCPFCGAELVRLQDKEPPGVARWDHPLPEVLSYEMCMLAGHTVWIRGPNDAARWNARSSPPADLKAVVEMLDWAAGIAAREEVAPMDDEHVLRLVYDDPEWGDNTVIAEVFVRFFRRAAEVHATLTASEPT